MSENTAKQLAAPTPEVLWFVARGSVLKGPFTSEQLEERIKKKEISFLDYCWRQGFREWRPIASVDILDRRRRLTRLPGYPTVEVPQGGRPSAPAPVASPRPELVAPEPVPVRISFSKIRKKSLSIYEWAIAAVLAVILAFLSTDFALKSVEESLLQRFQFHRLSWVQDLGEVSGDAPGLPPEIWSPLASAPSLADVQQAGLIELDVVFLAPLRREGTDHLSHGALKLDFGAPEIVDADREGLDPVFLQTFEVRGRLSALDFHRVHVEARGEPWIRR